MLSRAFCGCLVVIYTLIVFHGLNRLILLRWDYVVGMWFLGCKVLVFRGWL